jgi:two-component system LytT family response regulator
VARRLGERFLQVGRSVLINRDAVATLEHYAQGSYLVVLRDGTKVRTSRHYRDRVAGLLR